MSYHTLQYEDDNVYANITIKHEGNSVFPTNAEYRVTKTIPILSKCDDYYCSIIRFDVPLNETPLFIMPVQIPQVGLFNKDLTPFIIGIRTGGIDYTENIIYIPQQGVPAPVYTPPVTQQIVGLYYFVFEYQNLINMINTALAAAFVASGLGGLSPYFFLDTNTEQIKLVVDIATFAPISTALIPNPTPTATIFINQLLQNYLSSFETVYIGSSPRDYDFNLIQFGIQNTIPAFNPLATQRIYSQEYSTLGLWSSLKKIIFLSSSIPIKSEYTPANNSGISSTLPIITDFVPQIEAGGQSRSIAFYIPPGQYRLVDMNSSEQLNTLDIKIFWQDKDENIFPLKISKNQSSSIKIGFFKKSLYKNGTNLLKK